MMDYLHAQEMVINCPHDTDTVIQCSKATVHFQQMCNISNVTTIPYSVPTYVVPKLICDVAAMKTEQCVIGMKTYMKVSFFSSVSMIPIHGDLCGLNLMICMVMIL